MKKVIFFVVFVVLAMTTTFAQDIILKQSGDEIKSKIIEISNENIKYKEFDYQNGPIKNILISEVFMIIYENGRKEIFTKEEVSNISAQDSFQTQDSSQTTNSGEGFNLGLHLGIPVGDYEDFANFTLGLDVSYLFNVDDGFDVGIAIGYINFFSKDLNGFKFPDLGIIPIAASTRVALGQEWFIGIDLGYGIITNENSGGNGGFYYYPKIGFKLGAVDIFGYYQAMTINSFNYASFGVGASFNIN
jgi:hypothetical protein